MRVNSSWIYKVKKLIDDIKEQLEEMFFPLQQWLEGDPYLWVIILSDNDTTWSPADAFHYSYTRAVLGEIYRNGDCWEVDKTRIGNQSLKELMTEYPYLRDEAQALYIEFFRH